MKKKQNNKRLQKRQEKKITNKGVSLSDKKIFTGLFIIAFAGFLLRILNLQGVSLWVDEYVHVIRAQDFLKGSGPLFTNDNNGILLTFFIIPLFYFFSDSAFWARLPSVLFGTGSIVVVYFLAKRLFNKYVGFLSSFIFAFSLYNVYWSRLSRNYAIFAFFYLLLLYFFLKAFENYSNSNNALKRKGIDIKFVFLFVTAFVLSLLSHQLTFMFIFGISLYFIINEFIVLFDKNTHSIKNKYFWFSIISFIFLFLVINPVLSGYVKDLLRIFLPENIVTWVIPDWADLKVYYRENPFKIFNKYFDILKYDLKWMYLLGIGGLVLAWFYNKKSGAFLTSLFLFIFLLMSFIFYDPALPRYLIYIYPLFIISVAVFCYVTLNFIIKKSVNNPGGTTAKVLWLIPFILAGFTFRCDELKSLATAGKKYYFLVDRKLSEWSFTDWQYPCKYVENFKKPGDIIISTVPAATNYYLKTDSSIIFRQRYFDASQKKYVNYENTGIELPDARSVESLKRTLENYERGWLLADYYFYNVMTDPEARTLVCRHMDYHPQSSPDGGVLVFSWNKKNPDPKPYQAMLFVLGKSDIKMATPELQLNLDPGMVESGNLDLYIFAQNVSPREMIILINKKFRLYAPECKSLGIEQLMVDLKKGILQPGSNTIQIFYNEKVKLDKIRGFSIHNIGFN